MPEISRFYGIIIRMFFNDHNPPHFHAEYGDYRAIVNLEHEGVKGNMPKRALKLLREWTELHREQLMENWNACQNNELPKKVEPLK
ncbi:DUF4160 domain-containing protein [Aequorivita capsosiphonis]|uniref:DUF4160 domain-containing protein n=1 Tax=Aequorivita capsosiphonis TaxID=487317 RepID=UPI00047E4144|nr:DUF4160 domain-containing protein [Aequorivita capsosiphonis]